MKVIQQLRHNDHHRSTKITTSPINSIAASRPKRGRRRKRPELNDDQRRALRAAQNRQATRRSRERTRQRAIQLRTQLEVSMQEKQVLRAERDRLLAHVHSSSSISSAPGISIRAPSARPHNPMSIAAILNHDTNSGTEEDEEGSHAEETYYLMECGSETPPCKRTRSSVGYYTSPVSVASSASTDRLCDRKLQYNT